MKLLFAILMLIHGTIHLMGFVKAFKWANTAQLTQNITKPMGVLWFFTTLLFTIATVLFYLKIEWWSFIALPAVIISQILIINYWNDAKFGTLANLIIIIPIILGLAT